MSIGLSAHAISSVYSPISIAPNSSYCESSYSFTTSEGMAITLSFTLSGENCYFSINTQGGDGSFYDLEGEYTVDVDYTEPLPFCSLSSGEEGVGYADLGGDDCVESCFAINSPYYDVFHQFGIRIRIKRPYYGVARDVIEYYLELSRPTGSDDLMGYYSVDIYDL